MIFFYLANCPYCIKVNQWLEELYLEDSRFQKIPIEKIEESLYPQKAEQYDYYYVPCFYEGDKKIHEGIISKEELREILNNYLRR